MRCLDRDRRRIIARSYLGMENPVDDEGRLTGEPRLARGEAVELLPTMSADKGSVETDVFGQSLDYDRVLIFDDPEVDIDESTALWIDADEKAPHDYAVKRVAKTCSYTAVAVKRVEVRR